MKPKEVKIKYFSGSKIVLQEYPSAFSEDEDFVFIVLFYSLNTSQLLFKEKVDRIVICLKLKKWKYEIHDQFKMPKRLGKYDMIKAINIEIDKGKKTLRALQ